MLFASVFMCHMTSQSHDSMSSLPVWLWAIQGLVMCIFNGIKRVLILNLKQWRRVTVITIQRGFVLRNFKGLFHDDVIKWTKFPCNWPFVRGIHRSPVNSPHKGQWRGAVMFSLICVWTNGWVDNQDAAELGRHRDHYDVTSTTVSMFRCNPKCFERFAGANTLYPVLVVAIQIYSTFR